MRRRSGFAFLSIWASRIAKRSFDIPYLPGPPRCRYGQERNELCRNEKWKSAGMTCGSLWTWRGWVAELPDGERVVHGHTPTAEPVVTGSRIGIDTGAFATGVLTAVRLSPHDHKFLRVHLPV